MPDQKGKRVSIPFGSAGMVGEEELKRRSFDLAHFPMYLERKVPARVRITITTGCHADSDLIGWFEDGQHARRWQYASLIADDNGCLTDSDDFYRIVHAAFWTHADGLTYIGFTRCGTPVYAPLSGLAIMYRKYGRGIYLAGQMLPTPWPESSSEFLFTLR